MRCQMPVAIQRERCRKLNGDAWLVLLIAASRADRRANRWFEGAACAVRKRGAQVHKLALGKRVERAACRGIRVMLVIIVADHLHTVHRAERRWNGMVDGAKHGREIVV